MFHLTSSLFPAQEMSLGLHPSLLCHAVTRGPHISARQTTQRVGMSTVSAWRTLHSQKYWACCGSLHQCLNPPDFLECLNFCNCLLDMDSHLPGFSSNTLWSDKAHFARDTLVNWPSSHMWNTSSPHWPAWSARNQYQWSFNVWARAFNGRIIGPLFYDENLIGKCWVKNVLEGAMLLFYSAFGSKEINIFFLTGQCTSACLAQLRQFLNSHFPRQRIGHVGPVRWPVWFPELIP